MRLRMLTLAVVLTLGFTGSAATYGDGGEDAPTRLAGAAACIKAWNKGSNSAAQEKLLRVFADGGAGNVIAGPRKGRCVVAAYNVNRPKYVVFRQSGDAFAKAGGGPADQFNDFRASGDFKDVILQPSGEVKPVRN